MRSFGYNSPKGLNNVINKWTMTKDDMPLSILVIEDNPGDFVLIDDYLLEKFSAINVIHHMSFEAAASEIESFKNIDIILLDLVLPDLMGEQLVEKVQEHSGNVPIIILTGYSDIELARKTLSKGVSDFLIKDEINPEIIYKSIVYAKERKGYVNQLKQEKKVSQDLFDFSPQPMWIYDPVTLRFMDVNQAAITKYGYSLEEFLELTLRDIRPKDCQGYLEQSLKIDQRDNANHYAGKFKHQLKSGQEIWVEIYSSEIQYRGRATRLILSNDITDKQHYIGTIEDQNRKLKQIAWTQSHVVRAPLARLLGIINLFGLEAGSSDDQRFMLDQIRKSGEELDKIIQGIIEQTNAMDLKDINNG